MTSRIPRTFAFDKEIPQIQYQNHLDPDDLLNESFERAKQGFEFYRKKKIQDIEKDEQLQKSNAAKDRLKSKMAQIETPVENPIQKIKLPQNQVISELDPVNVIISKTREKIRFLEFQNDRIKKRVQQDDFANGHKTKSKTIQKTNLDQQQIFNENDFQRLIDNEDYLDQQSERVKGKKEKGTIAFTLRSKGSSRSYKQIVRTAPTRLNEDVVNRARSTVPKQKVQNKNEELQKKTLIVQEQMKKLQRTCQSFGVYEQSVIDFRVNTLRDARLMRLQMENEDVQQHPKNEVDELKTTNMQSYLMNVMTKPQMDKKVTIIRNVPHHQGRIKEMTRQTQGILQQAR